MKKRIRIGLCMLAALGAFLPRETGAQACLAPGERRAAVARGEAVPLRVAVDAVRRQIAGPVVRADLCRDGPGLVYRMSFLDARGAIRFVLVEARGARVISVR